MEEILTKVESIADVHALGRNYLIVWCFVYDEERGTCDTLRNRLQHFDVTDVPSGMLFVDASLSPWASKDMPHHTKRPVLMAFSCGFCITTISSENEFEEKAAVVLNFARQVKTHWLAASA